MPFPEKQDEKSPWPPMALGADRKALAEASAWYSDDIDTLESFYASDSPTGRNGGQMWWSRRAADKNSSLQRVHVPIASDMAQVSSDLLFGEDVEVTPESNMSEAEQDAANKAIEAVVEEIQLMPTLVEAAETAAGVAGVFLVPTWDEEGPVLRVLQPDVAVPVWENRRLMEVIFWSVVHTRTPDRKSVYRHLEKWDKAGVEHRLYLGTDDTIGTQVDLAMSPATADLEETMEMPIDRMAVEYVPNMLPVRKNRSSKWGRADSAGSESMMDALDEAMTSWMRDIRLGQSRLLMPDEYLMSGRTGTTRNRGGGKGFDLDAELIMPLDVDPRDQEKAGITEIQFSIRTADHEATVLRLIDQIVTSGGYSSQTFGIGVDGSAESGTALRIKEKRTYRTRAKKIRYWRPAISRVMEVSLAIWADQFAIGSPVFRPQVAFPQPDESDISELAASLEVFGRAQAMSLRTRVGMAQPHLTAVELDAEVASIQAETGALVNGPPEADIAHDGIVF